MRPVSGPRDALDVASFGGGQPARDGDAVDVAGRRGRAAVADRAFGDRRGLVAGVEDRGVDGGAVGRDGERARRVAEERDDRRAASREPRCAGVEDPHVGAADARRGELRVARAVLAAMRRGDEGAAASGAGEDDVARLVADQERAHDARRVGRDVDDADAVGQVVHHPDLAVGARRDRHGLEPDRHRAGVRRDRPAPTSKISSRASGVLTAKSRLPSGDSASGRTWPLSKVTNGACAPAGRQARATATSRPGTNRPGRQTVIGTSRASLPHRQLAGRSGKSRRAWSPLARCGRYPGHTGPMNLGLAQQAIAARNPDRECIVTPTRRLTYAEVASRARRLANVLRGAGLGVRRERARARRATSPGRIIWASTC